MRRNVHHTALLFVFLIAVSCKVVQNETQSENQINKDSEWLIPSDDIVVGTGRDAIPSIDDPKFNSPPNINFIEDNELVLGLKIKDQIKAYPHAVLNYHEVINDELAGVPVSIAFCPLTGSGIAWKRHVNGKVTTFGVSGLIYKNNLIAYDRLTESYWSQMKVLGVHGSQKGKVLGNYQLVETTWETWKNMYPESMVLTGETGYDRNYSLHPYGDGYSSNNQQILFPIGNEDDRLERKTLGHGIYYKSSLHVFPIKGFPEQLGVYNRNIAGNEIVIAGSSRNGLAVSYSRKLEDETTLTFQNATDDLPVLMEDNEGNKWNIFGEAVSGPRKGTQLEAVPSYNAYWFAWADFFGFGPKRPIIVWP